MPDQHKTEKLSFYGVFLTLLFCFVFSSYYQAFRDRESYYRGRLEVNRSMCKIYVKAVLKDPNISKKDRLYAMRLLFQDRYDVDRNGLYCETGKDKLKD